MKVEATVDVGENITGLVEKLAQQIGTTTDKVFPWYVQQSYLEGVTTLVAIGVAITVFGLICAVAAFRAKWADTGPGPADLICISSGVALAFSVFIGFCATPEATRQIINPQFYAMQMMTKDIRRMTGKW